MIHFKPISINDKNWVDKYIAAAKVRGSHQNFANLYAWAKVYKYQLAVIDKHLIIKGRIENEFPYYFFPIGEGDPNRILNMMRKDALERGHEFILFGLSEEDIPAVEDIFPGQVEWQSLRGSFDYVYSLDDLIQLKGNKHRNKRNHINYFLSNYKWKFEEITMENLHECWAMNIEWCKVNRCQENLQLALENCAVRRCFNNFHQLKLEGGLLRVDGSIVAYTMGDRLSADTYDIHVEKAFRNIRGAYQMINREFAAHIRNNYPEIKYINREEDMGNKGLRKAKESYHPLWMQEKYMGRYTSEVQSRVV